MDKLQFDWQKRVVSLSNLEAMCDRVSGICHTYRVVKTSPNRVTVEYSNPDEYGHSRPMFAVFPAYPCDRDGEIAVVLDILRVTHDDLDREGWQYFQVIIDCPELWRNPANGEWETRDQIEARLATK